MIPNRKAGAFALLSVASLGGGCVLAVVLPGLQVALVAAGFVAYVVCGSRAIALWKLDDRVFDHPHRHLPRRGPVDPSGAGKGKIAAAAVLALFLVAPMTGQQTIFNVPSADVLAPGEVYAEADELFRPTDPRFSTATIRGVVGVVPRMEAGVNFGGLSAPGPLIPTATAAVKIQPLRAAGVTVTAGGYGLFSLTGSPDGNPAGMGYGFASYRIAGLGTRFEIGGWYSSAGFASPHSTGGALATLEQPVPWVPGLMIAADWWSGENTIGYVSPGLICGLGSWTAYAAYSTKNGDSKGNAGLIELGYAF
jgi:hypothetical protein